ncbi:MAG: aspartate kinase [Tissierellia bacterium]|nr:aspartate kinase [Tissierellia bacterium]
MIILVQKFGGTSVASEESRNQVYKKIEEAVNNGYSLVVVVSAMGRTGDPYATDTLLNLIRNDYPFANKRELDVIFSCGENISGTIVATSLQKKGYKSVYLTGAQAGIITDNNYSNAKITKIDNQRIISLLKEGNIVVVGGSQGVSEGGDITTLGRGGSDTTACALGISLNAYEVDIFTDVEGIMTADPRKVSNTRILDEISYEDCCIMAQRGAQVIHPRAVEVAMQSPDMRLYVKSTFSNHMGTLISREKEEFNGILNLISIAGHENLVYGKIICDEYKTIVNILNIVKGTELVDYSIYCGKGGIIITTNYKNYKTVEKYIKENGFEVTDCQNVSEISIIGSNFSTFPEFYEELKNKIMAVVNVKICLLDNRFITFIIESEHYVQTINFIHDYVINQLKQQVSFNN